MNKEEVEGTAMEEETNSVTHRGERNNQKHTEYSFEFAITQTKAFRQNLRKVSKDRKTF